MPNTAKRESESPQHRAQRIQSLEKLEDLIESLMDVRDKELKILFPQRTLKRQAIVPADEETQFMELVKLWRIDHPEHRSRAKLPEAERSTKKIPIQIRQFLPPFLPPRSKRPGACLPSPTLLI